MPLTYNIHIPYRAKTLFICSGISFFSILIRLINLNFPFGDYDEGVYIATVRSVIHGFPLIEKTYTSQFPLFIYISEFVYKLFPSITALRLLSVISSVSIIILSFLLLKKYIGLFAASVISLYLSINSLFLIVSRTYQLDMPWLCLCFLSFWLLLVFDEKKNFLYLILSSITFTASILIKANPLFIVVLVCYLVYLFIDDKQKAFLYSFVYITIALLVFFLVIPVHDLPLLLQQSLSARGGGISISLSTIFSGERIVLFVHEIFMILLDCAGVILIVYEVVKSRNIKEYLLAHRFIMLSSIWLCVSAAVMLVYNPLFQHHLIYFILPSALFAAYPIEWLWRRKYLQVIIILFLVLSFIYVGRTTVSDKGILFPQLSVYDKQLQAAVTYIDTHTSSSAYVISDDQIVLYLANKDTPPYMVDTSYVRIAQKKLSLSQVIAQIRSYNVQGVVLVSGRLNKIPGLESYLFLMYQHIAVAGVDIFTKK